jgi:hypothetical protein
MRTNAPAANRHRSFSDANKATLLTVPAVAQVKVAQVKVAQVKVAQVKVAQVKVAQVKVAQVKVAQVKVAQVKVAEGKVDLVVAEVSARPTRSWKRLTRIKTAR